MQIGVNHLRNFALTNMLLKRMTETKFGNVNIISSHARMLSKINFDDTNSEKSYESQSAYAQSKLANIMFAKELQRKLKSTNITVHAIHPGFFKTVLTRYVLPGKTFDATFDIYLEKSAVGDKCKHD